MYYNVYDQLPISAAQPAGDTTAIRRDSQDALSPVPMNNEQEWHVVLFGVSCADLELQILM